MADYKRISKYYKGCDGTKLAVDVYLPEGCGAEKKCAVVALCGNGGRRGGFERYEDFAARLREKNIAIAFIEPRGIGASYGHAVGFYDRLDARDVAAVIDQLGEQDWCTGKVGMFGGSHMGNIQQIVLAENPKHLAAAAPCDCNPNFYYQNYVNGASMLPERPNNHKQPLDKIGDPVDDDPAPDYPQAHEALTHHVDNIPFLGQYVQNMYRDSVTPGMSYAINMEVPIWNRLDNLKYGSAKVYQNAAWYDPGCTGEIIGFKYFGGKLLLGPWAHCQIYRENCDLPNSAFDWKTDHIEYFDNALNGVDNDYFERPPIHYYTRNAKPGAEWNWAADWPVDGQTSPELYLDNGAFSEKLPEQTATSYKVRSDITLYGKMGKMMRRNEREVNEDDAKCLTFTTEALEKDMELTGIPVVDIWVTSTWKNGNFLAIIEEVMPDGSTILISDGAMRASHAVVGSNPAWDSLGLPYHPGMEKDAVELSETEPLNLAFNLEATSYVVRAGSKLRLCIMCGDNSNYRQPAGFPDDVTIKLWTGGKTPSFLRLPARKPTVTKFEGKLQCSCGMAGDATVYAFKRGVYINQGASWKYFPCVQVYPKGDATVFVTEKFTAVREVKGATAYFTIDEGAIAFKGEAEVPVRQLFSDTSEEIKKYMPTRMAKMRAKMGGGMPVMTPTFKSLYVASVPVRENVKGQMSMPQPYNTMDLFIDVMLPEGDCEKWPCIVSIHGFSSNHHTYDRLTPYLLKMGYAVASIDYRTYPPNTWPAPSIDAKGAIRYLKAHAKELRLDPERFGVCGGSCGGHLSAMVAATNGDPAMEGDIGGNTEFDSSVKAAAIYYPWTDAFTFGDQNAEKYPGEPHRVAQSDGPFAPPGAMIGYVGQGKGMGELKKHYFDSDPEYQALIALAKESSPVFHVTEKSCPSCFVHGNTIGIGIQIPMAQSIEMFEALTAKGVKSLVFLNNNGQYGGDPEVRQAVLSFLANRV